MSKKGKAYLLDGDGVIICKMSTMLMKSPIENVTDAAGDSFGRRVDSVECATRPFDMSLYKFAMSVNTYHFRACKVKARDIVGRGWKLIPEKTDASPNEKVRDEIESFLNNCHRDQTITQIAECVEIDYQGLGNGYLEIRRNKLKLPVGLGHYPAAEMWIRLDRKGFIQEKNQNFRHLVSFGMKSQTSKEQSDQNEMIHMADYHPLNSYYGIPCIMPAFGRMALMQLELEYNMSFFANQTMARWAVMLEGEFENDTEDIIEQYFSSHVKGKAHRTLVLTVPEKGVITFQKLDSDAKDSHFRFMRKDARDEVIHAHGTPPQKLGIVETGALGGNTGAQQLQDYKDSIVQPGQERWENVFKRIIQDGWPDCGWDFKYNEFDLEDKKINAEVDSAYLDRGVVVPNETRRRRFPDLDPLPGGDEPLKRSAEAGNVLEAVKALQQTLTKAVRGAARKSFLKRFRKDAA